MATKQHCAYCFAVLQAQLEGASTHGIEAGFDTAAEYPLFVTWTKPGVHGSGGERLRGCIGNFAAMALGSGLREYALTSALRDSRFAPIRRDEMPRLTCAVSLLTDFEEAADHLDWEVGRHGVWIEFRMPGSSRKRTATFLPEIAAEQGWSKEETIDHLLRKGGYELAITKAARESVRLTRYQSSKAHLSYDEFRAMAAADP
ncbi:hypothetical protein IWQ56_001783 [Coemansia nantahalensis]|uniref:Uncharacterized protein n=1 Tax=Coemansia nantahalensis TaxID=2789366 RepID=A0ACC1K762_9FUNG|nr:hypothetical protein IWQ56_001783 [Coemansia nantahalensis]KAJ2774396.1 hypothetical protein IWQ57_000838 [Coemansia nantahalensis]